MPTQFDRGFTAGVLLVWAARAGNALITPPANAGGEPMYGAAAQMVVCLAAAVWVTWKYRLSRQAAT